MTKDEPYFAGKAPSRSAVFFQYANVDEIYFNEEYALATLLLDGVVVVGQDSLFIDCNDVFAWGCGDGEVLPLDEIQEIYEYHIKDKVWGTAVWCMKKRNCMPQAAVAKMMREGGIWDIDNLSLQPNGSDRYWQEQLNKNADEKY